MTTSGEAQRLFIAVPVPDDVRMALAAALDPVRRRVRGGRWSAPETWHLTLRFLGDTLPDAVPGIRDGCLGRRGQPEAVRRGARPCRRV